MLTWIFDLDNTLHDATPHIMPHINRSMTEYVQRQLAVGEAEAADLRVQYWRRYGATLLGLMRHHDTDPHHFLWHTHQFPELRRMVAATAQRSGANLPGGSSSSRTRPPTTRMRCSTSSGWPGFFDAVYTIEHTRYRPKPDLAGFGLLLHAEGVVPERAVMVDDMLVNLRAARRLGMATVWVSRPPRTPGYVDARIVSIRELPRRVDRLRRSSACRLASLPARR